jgi:hypothetical protein
VRNLASTGLVLASLIGVAPLGACEPILPMFLVIGGAATLAHSLRVLVVVILVKAVVFACIQRPFAPGANCVRMVWANIVSTLVGGFAAALAAGLPLIGLCGILACAYLPSRRIAQAYPLVPWQVTSGLFMIGMLGLVVMSFALWAVSQSVLEPHQTLGTPKAMAFYWSMKIGFVFLGLLCGLVITIFWEEWMVSWMMPKNTSQKPCFPSVLWANVIVLGLVAVYAAALMLPRRLASGDFLVLLLNALRHLA